MYSQDGLAFRLDHTQSNALESATPSASPRHLYMSFFSSSDSSQSSAASLSVTSTAGRRPSLSALMSSPTNSLRRFFPANLLQHNDADDRAALPGMKEEQANPSLVSAASTSLKRKQMHSESTPTHNQQERKHSNDDRWLQQPKTEEEDDEDSDEEECDEDKAEPRKPAAGADRFAVNGLSCHQCKTRRKKCELLFCHYMKTKKSKKGGQKACKKKFCFHCIQKFYGGLGSFEDMKPMEKEYMCPGCKGVCSCASCKRSRERKQMKALIKSQNYSPAQSNQGMHSAFIMPTNPISTHTPINCGKAAGLPPMKKYKSLPLTSSTGSVSSNSSVNLHGMMQQLMQSQTQMPVNAQNALMWNECAAAGVSNTPGGSGVQLFPPLLAPTAQLSHSTFPSAAPSPSSASSSNQSTPLSSCSVSSLSSPALSMQSDCTSAHSMSPALSMYSNANSHSSSAVPSSLPSPTSSAHSSPSKPPVHSVSALPDRLTQELQTLCLRDPQLANALLQIILNSQIQTHNDALRTPSANNANMCSSAHSMAHVPQSLLHQTESISTGSMSSVPSLLSQSQAAHVAYHSFESVSAHSLSQPLSHPLTSTHSHIHPSGPVYPPSFPSYAQPLQLQASNTPN